MFAGGAAWRKRLNDEIGDQGDVSRLIEKRCDEELAALMNNLGGHDLPSVLDAFHSHQARQADLLHRYTVKGFGLPFAGHKDNHAGLMTPAQMETFREANERAARATNGTSSKACRCRQTDLQDFSSTCRSRAGGERRLNAPAIAVPDACRHRCSR